MCDLAVGVRSPLELDEQAELPEAFDRIYVTSRPGKVFRHARCIRRRGQEEIPESIVALVERHELPAPPHGAGDLAAARVAEQPLGDADADADRLGALPLG